MFAIEDFIIVGKVIKTHGNKGEIIIKTEVDIHEMTVGMEYLFININGLIPYKISDYAIRNNENIQFALSNLDTVESANKLVGKEVYVESSLIKQTETKKPLAIIIEEYTVYDKTYGEVGRIANLISINNNPLIRILIDKEEILIPFNEDFIERTDYENKIIFMDLPEGLLSINKQ